jgi:CheY-like chemotaxis protein
LYSPHMKRILVADDQPAARELLATILTHSGYQVFEAVDGIDAAEKASAVEPDLILLDIHMPGTDGLTLCSELRRDPRFTNIPIVALTAGLMGGERERALEAGFTEFLSKPVSIAVLRETIAGLIS